jgi:hypothetical protein
LLAVERLQVVSLDVAFQEVSWRILDTSEDVTDYTFQLFRSESVAGPFEPLGEPFQDRYVFLDTTVQTGHRWRQYHYKLQVTHRGDGKSATHGPVSMEPPVDKAAQAIRRDIQILMREFAGRPCWVFPVRTFGQRCSCYDMRLRTKVRSGCVTCFDTSFVRGYLQPIEVWVQIDPSSKGEEALNVATTQQSNTTGRLGFYPQMKPHDMIVESENRRWRVERITQTEKHRARIHQEVQLHEIPQTDVRYRVPVGLGISLRDMFRLPPRQLVNPANEENFQTEQGIEILKLFR